MRGVRYEEDDIENQIDLDTDLNLSGDGSADDSLAPGTPGNPLDPVNMHGTGMAGTIAAEAHNNIGILGVAHDATVVPIRLFEGRDGDPVVAYALDSEDLRDAFEHLADGEMYPADDQVDVSNNSWKPKDYEDIPQLVPIDPLASQGLATGVTEGRGGLGVIYVFAAGNDDHWPNTEYDPYWSTTPDNMYHSAMSRVSYNGYASDRRVIAVGATDQIGFKSHYSEPGCSLLVNATSGSDRTWWPQYRDNTSDVENFLFPGWFAASLTVFDDNIEDPFRGEQDGYILASGTSTATAHVSGVVALMLQANPDLTWRDVQHILVATADTGDSRLADPNPGPGLDLAADWFQNGAGRWYNPEYGFGRVDAARAVEVAQSWINVPGEEFTSHFWEPETPSEYKIYDPDGQTFYPLHVPLPIDDEDFYVEHVEAVVDIINHAPRGDLQIALVSPMDTWSVMHVPHDDANTGMIGVRFTTVEGWGEATEGEWTLAVADGVDNGSSGGRIKDVEIRVYGFPVTSAPQVQDPSPHTTLASYPITVPCHLASGTAPVTWSLDSPPPDVTIDPLTGIVTWHSGDPDDQRTVTVRATNLTGSDTASLTMIRIQPE